MFQIINEEFIRQITRDFKSENLMLKLFTNNITPNYATAEGDLTEMFGQSYSAIEIDYTTGIITEGSTGVTITFPTQTFTLVSGTVTNIYGYYIVGKTTGDFKGAEVFPAPWPVQGSSITINITAIINYKNQS